MKIFDFRRKEARARERERKRDRAKVGEPLKAFGT